MAKIFISYSRASKDVVEELVKDLADDDQETWFDQHLMGGQKWWDNILSEIRKCEIFVAALTPDFIESKACQREIKYAKDLQKILLPVRLSGNVSPDSLPLDLGELQWVDYSLRNVEAFKSLRRTLKNLPKASPLPDTLPDAPAVPISYLSNLRTKIGSDSQLQLQDQIQLVFELRRQFRNGDPAKELIDLLQRLKNRDDLFAVVSQDIDHLIRDIGREFPIADRLPPPEPEPPGPEEDGEPSKMPVAAPPITPLEAPVVDAPITLFEPPAIDQPVTPPEPAAIDQLVTQPEPAVAEEPALLSEPPVVDQHFTPPVEQAEAVHVVASDRARKPAASGTPNVRLISLGAAAGAILLLVAARSWFFGRTRRVGNRLRNCHTNRGRRMLRPRNLPGKGQARRTTSLSAPRLSHRHQTRQGRDRSSWIAQAAPQ